MKIRNILTTLLLILILSIGVSTISGAEINENSLSSTLIHANNIINNYNNTSCHSEVSGKCNKVVDGDTIWVEGIGKVRFVGVNTPERGEPGYNESKNFVKQVCLNKEVSLDIDNKKHYDKYNRTLAVVIVDGKNLNEILLKEKLAEVMFIPPSEFNPYNWQ